MELKIQNPSHKKGSSYFGDSAITTNHIRLHNYHLNIF